MRSLLYGRIPTFPERLRPVLVVATRHQHRSFSEQVRFAVNLEARCISHIETIALEPCVNRAFAVPIARLGDAGVDNEWAVIADVPCSPR